MIYSLVYVSEALHPWTRVELLDLLAGCRARNTDLGVTGILLYQDGTFMQMLEGEQETVLTLYRKILADSRHRDVVNVWVSLGVDRQFPDWTMAFRDLEQAPIPHLGFNDVLTRPVDVAQLRRTEVVDELLSILQPAA